MSASHVSKGPELDKFAGTFFILFKEIHETLEQMFISYLIQSDRGRIHEL